VTADQLCQRLGKDRKTLDQWVRRGLPRRKKGRVWHYDADDVSAWLIAQGIATRARVVQTQDQVAQALGKSPRMVGYYVAAGMPGSQGAYDLDTIEAWLKSRAPTAGPDDARKSAAARFMQAKAERAELDLAEQRGELVNLHDVIAWINTHIPEARATLQELAGSIPAALPEDTPDATRKAVRELVDSQVRHALQLLSALARGPSQPDP
jgi:phage terminase Nu1 subunit (DNA packaging protein)